MCIRDSHYVRAYSVEQVVMLELRRMADFLRTDEDAFADLLAQKTNKEMLKEQKPVSYTHLSRSGGD